MKLSSWILPLIIALILTAVAIVGARSKQSQLATPIACIDPVRGCTFSHRGQTAQLRFSHPPKPLQVFTLTVRAPGARQMHAQFQMQGMEMGAGSYALAIRTLDTFSAPINLPVCVTGRRDWKLYLQIDAQRYEMPFSSS